MSFFKAPIKSVPESVYRPATRSSADRRAFQKILPRSETFANFSGEADIKHATGREFLPGIINWRGRVNLHRRTETTASNRPTTVDVRIR